MPVRGRREIPRAAATGLPGLCGETRGRPPWDPCAARRPIAYNERISPVAEVKQTRRRPVPMQTPAGLTLRRPLRRGTRPALPRRRTRAAPARVLGMLMALLPSLAALAADPVDPASALPLRGDTKAALTLATDELRQANRRLAEQADALQRLLERIDDSLAPASHRVAPGRDAAAGARAPDAGPPAIASENGRALTEENARLRFALDSAQRRLDVLVEQFVAAQQARQVAEANALVATGQVAALEARQQQQQLGQSEAMLRAEKAEKLRAALEEEQARIRTENEKLKSELETARLRQNEALQQTAALEARLATAEARVGQLTHDGAAVAEAPPPARGGRAAATGTPSVDRANGARVKPVIYVVRPNDTLSRISARVYGDASAWPRIYRANRDQLSAPDRLTAGMTLVLP